MTTLTSTGNVNLTSSTNWSPAQTPVAGDDLIINGAHNLTLDADITLGSVTFSNSNARLLISGTMRVVNATNGWTAAANLLTAVIATTLTAGMSVTLRGTWFGIAFGITPIAASTGGNLTLATIGDDPSGVLFADTTGQRQITASWTGGILTTIGRFNMPSFGSHNTFVSNHSGGTWNHTNTGTSQIGGGSHLMVSSAGSAVVNWTGDLTSGSTAGGNLFGFNGSGNASINGNIKRTAGGSTGNIIQGNTGGVVGVSTSHIGTVTITGLLSVAATSRASTINCAGASGSRINWRSQSLSIPSTDAVVICNGGSTVFDITSLVVSNTGKFAYLELQAGCSAVVDSTTSITNTTTTAQAVSISNSGAIEGKIVNFPSPAPTLPPVAQVAAGTSYGYAATPLIGAGLIMDPATLATAMITSFGSLPEVMVRTTIATLASQTEFTLTAGSADEDVYNGLTVVITDQSTSVQKAVATVSDYVGSTRTVTLSAAPGFTIATGDSISIIAGASGGGGGGSSFPAEAPANWLKAAGIQDGALTAAKFAASALNGKGDWLTSLGTNAPASWLNAAAFAAGSLNGKGDWATSAALTTVSSTLQSMITALNNLSAKANWFGSLLLEIPDSGTRDYLFELVVRDDEDKLTNLDASPTIALVNAAGTDRSSLITTTIANQSTGRYTLTITVGPATANESLKLTATGTISGETRYAVITPQVVDYDSATLINSIYTRIGEPEGASIAVDIAASKTVTDAVNTKIGTPSVTVSADIATRLASASYTAPDNAGISSAASSAASAASAASAVNTKIGTPVVSVAADIASVKTDTGTTIPGLFSTLTTKVRKFLQLLVRKDSAIATDNATELSELNANGGSGAGAFNQSTDSLEAIRDRGDAAWITGASGGAGDAEQATLLAVQQTVNNIASAISGTVVVSGRVAPGGRLTVYQGEEWSEARQTAQSISVVDPTGGIYTKLSGIGAANLRFGASRMSEAASIISGTVHSVYQATVDSQLRCMIKIEMSNAGSGAQIADDYKYQVKQVVSSSDFIEIEGDLSLRRMRV